MMLGGLRLLVGLTVVGLAGVVLDPLLPDQARREAWLERWNPLLQRWKLATWWSRIHDRRRYAGRGGRLGLSVVDARTGGPVKVSSAIREELFDAAVGWAAQRIFGPGMVIFQARHAAAEAAVSAEKTAGAELDELAFQRAMMQRLGGDNGNLRGCLGMIVLRLIVPHVPIPFDARRQSLRQRFAGVMVVRAER
jgi:hypothetical protein